MGLENFVPEIWSAKIFVRLRKDQVFTSVVNTDYEGDISGYGDTVKINEIGPITVSNYAKHGTLSWQSLSSAQKQLVIDQAKSFSFVVDDIENAQTNPKILNSASDEASYAIRDTIDQFIAGLYAQAGVTGTAAQIGTSATSLTVSSGNVIETLSYAQRLLTDHNVPQGGRFLIAPPWLHQKLILAEVGGISATAVPKVRDDGVIMNGFVGNAMGFEILVSNNVSNDGTQYRVMCGNRQAISYAGQLSSIKAVERENSFETGIKGLYVYGAKVVRPEALCTLYLAEGTS